MKTLNIEISNKQYIVEVPENEDERKQGLMNRESLDDDKGMLFIFDSIGTHEMWMKNTLIPLDQIFMNEDQEVIKVVKRVPKDEDLIGCENTLYVLEVNVNSGIKTGDEMEIVEEDSDDAPVMKVLAPDGSTQMELWGGERIVSRRETKILIKKAKRAFDKKTEESKQSAYKSLGKYMFKVLDGQSSRDPEYVQLPE